jgi:hypothetical protein
MNVVAGRLENDLLSEFFPFTPYTILDDNCRVCLLNIPIWMSIEWYNLNQTKMTYAYHYGLNPNNMESKWFIKLFDLDLIKIYSVAELLKVKNFRSSFRSSLRMQLEDWLDGESNYKSPFSQKQWDSLTKGNEIYGQMDLTFQTNPFVSKVWTLEEFKNQTQEWGYR